MVKLDDLNQKYFNSLLNKYKKSSKNERYFIFEKGKEIPEGRITVFPTAICSPDLLENIDVYHYHEIDECENMDCRDIVLWIKKMQAGTGSSLTRSSYLEDVINKDPIIGAKGTDLFKELSYKGEKRFVSIAEIQLLQAYFIANKNKNFDIIWQDIVGPETVHSVGEIWKMPSLIDPNLSYQELFKLNDKISYNGLTFQGHQETIDEDGKLTSERVSPGGHALFAVDSLMSCFKQSMRPKEDKKTLIASVGNGEDLSSQPDKKILRLMKDKKIAIAMLTTTKTENDMKGGQISIAKHENGEIYATIIEKAQAEESGQLGLFEQIGLSVGSGISFFNTNMALFNYDVLIPKITKLVSNIGEENFLDIIAPDLIQNTKIQKNEQGEDKKFIQLEGAMGSVLLNLDKYYRETFGESLVSFINIDKANRTQFFSPIKTAFDFFMQFHSDRFSLNDESMSLINNRKDSLPSVNLSHTYYSDTKNTLDSFKNTSIRDLDSLRIKGIVNLSNLTLKGRISISSESGDCVELKSLLDGNNCIENQEIFINQRKEILSNKTMK